MKESRRRRGERRKGAACVEFAMVAPIFVIIVLGVSEVSKLCDIQNRMAVAAREGARVASMDRNGWVKVSQTTNGVVAKDIKNFLKAGGLRSTEASVFVVDAVDHTTMFDLDDPANDLKMFEIRVEMPYITTGGIGLTAGESMTVSAKVVFRNGRAAIGQ